MYIKVYLYTINLGSVPHWDSSLKFSDHLFPHTSFNRCRLEQAATFDRLQCKLMIMNNRNLFKLLLFLLLLLFLQQRIFWEVIDVFNCCHYSSACRGNDAKFCGFKVYFTKSCTYH